eukprot:CAMPEP_0176202216 /NCGR_PEP_ID=MMETSP0121_2-20121125/9961_1 /TAXON_ID=160619 /ORGANISM="Kryptoperidinium foliaceum, Strain CCMP 1326" /LENGTH=82 /DNA_ID=CAMNT_0017541105 /DNA_START=115 /DNA_END=361 /DNA_ORIENTATION=-
MRGGSAMAEKGELPQPGLLAVLFNATPRRSNFSVRAPRATAPEADSHVNLSRILVGACRRAGPATRDLLGGRPVGGRLQVGL